MGKGKEFAVKTAAFLGITAATVSNGTNGWEEASEITGQPLDSTVSSIISVLHVPSQPDVDISDAIEEILNGIENKEKAEAASGFKNELASASPPDPPPDNTQDNSNEAIVPNAQEGENTTEETTAPNAQEGENTTEEVTIMDDFGTVDNPDETVTDENNLEDFGTLDDETTEETTEEETEIDIDSEEDYEIDDE